MSLRLFAAPVGLPALHEFDDAGTDTDAGTAFTTTADGHPVTARGASGDDKLRRLIQWVSLQGDAVVTITPVADGVPATDQAYTATLLVADGSAQRLEVPCSLRGRRFAALVEIVSGTAASLGEAELHILPKRSLSGGARP